MATNYQTKWDNSPIYSGLEDPEIEKDILSVQKTVERIQELSQHITQPLAVDVMTELSALRQQVLASLADLQTFCRLHLSVDGQLEVAKSLLHRVDQLVAESHQSVEPFHRALILAEEGCIENYLQRGDNHLEAPRLRFLRRQRDHILSLEGESVIKALAVEGFQAWDRLYSSLGGGLKCALETSSGLENVSLGRASALRASEDNELRRASYYAIHRAWRDHDETCSAILNSLVGWRLKEDALRSYKKPLHFLDPALEQGRLSSETLWTMLKTVEEEGREIAARAMQIKARVLGKTQLDPWDILAAPPKEISALSLSYPMSIQRIAQAAESLGEEPAEFVKMMATQGYIDVEDSPHRTHGAYCTRFFKTRTPRIFMTYDGQPAHAITLAHELGHAYHDWVLRDLPIDQAKPPMTLAETASTFFETLFKDHLHSSQDLEGGPQVAAWQNLTAAVAFLADIPHRFYTEFDMYEAVKAGRRLSPEILRESNVKNSQRFFGPAVSSHNEDFWLSKLHFYLSSVRFYNYPYTFGYLLSLFIYQQGRQGGESFLSRYKDLLRDCGRLTCEELVEKHLQRDVTQPDFWREALHIVRRQMDRAEEIFAAAES